MAIEGGVEVLGVIENMSGYVCPKCKNVFYPLMRGGGEKLAQDLDVSFLGRIPLDPIISYSSDVGLPFVYSHPESPASQAMISIADQIEQKVSMKEKI